MIELGSQIKATREAHHLSLETISERTRINIKFLEAIEEGKWDFLPEPYVRAFVRMYANEVGLNGEELLLKYELLKKKNEQDQKATEQIEAQLEKHAGVSSWRKLLADLSHLFSKHRSEVLLIALFALIIFSIAFIYLRYSHQIFDQPAQDLEEIPIDTTKILQNSAQVKEPPEKSLELELRTREETWVQISVDDSTAREFTFPKDARMRWKGKTKFVLKIGNAGGVDLVLNGSPLEDIGRRGKVVALEITKEGISRKR